MDKLQTRIKKVEEQFFDEVITENHQTHLDQRHKDALVLVGAFKAAKRISDSIGSEVILNLVRFCEEKRYEDLGFSRFTDFLESDLSPLSRHEFYERKSLLEKEGPVLFDLFAANNISHRTRRLLKDGSVEIDGDVLIISDGRGETQRIPVTDKTVWIESLTACCSMVFSSFCVFFLQFGTG